MTAQPIQYEEDPGDPLVILRGLPERERAEFLRQYEGAVDAAHEPAGYRNLQRILRAWSVRAKGLEKLLQQEPDYYEKLQAEVEAVKNGTVQTVPIEEVFPDWEDYVAAAHARRTG